MKYIITILLVVVAITSETYASVIVRLDLKELPNISEYIVLGKVISISPEGNRDAVTIKIATQLKGNLQREEVTFMLTTRGGLKDFDPQLVIGDTGVFFLSESNGKIKKAYWGSIAVFNKNNFKQNE